ARGRIPARTPRRGVEAPRRRPEPRAAHEHAARAPAAGDRPQPHPGPGLHPRGERRAPDRRPDAPGDPRAPSRDRPPIPRLARRHGDFALVGVAVVVSRRSDGACGHARLVFCGVGPTPVRVARAEALVSGRRPDAAVFAAVEGLVRETLQPDGDLHASADYRREVAGVVARRALTTAWSRTNHG